MDAHRQALVRVHEAMQWFLVAQEVRLQHIVVSDDMRLPALEQIAVSEHSSLNRTPFVVLEAPVEQDDSGFALRAAELRDDWAQLAERYAEEDPPVVLPPLREALTGDGLVAFGGELGWMLDHLPEPLEGLTVVLAPVWVRDDERWVEDLGAVLAQPRLRRARFVVVDAGEDRLAELVVQLRELAESADARVDAEAARAGVRSMIEQMANAPAGASGARLSGMAGPSVAPPRRWNAAAEQAPEDASRMYFDAELPSGLSDQGRVQELKVAILRAAEAASGGDPATAVSHQSVALNLAADLGLDREALVLLIALGSYHLQAGDWKAAEACYGRARERAIADNEPTFAAQAQLALASAQLLAKRPLDAAASYEWVARVAYQTAQPALGIEAYRLAGEVYEGQGMLDRAGEAWRRGLGFAQELSAEERKASVAVEVAELLTVLCRRQGDEAAAAGYEAQATALRAEAEAPIGAEVSADAPTQAPSGAS